MEAVSGKKTDSFCVNIEMVLIVVHIPEGRVVGVRDVAYRWCLVLTVDID